MSHSPTIHRPVRAACILSAVLALLNSIAVFLVEEKAVQLWPVVLAIATGISACGSFIAVGLVLFRFIRWWLAAGVLLGLLIALAIGVNVLFFPVDLDRQVLVMDLIYWPILSFLAASAALAAWSWISHFRARVELPREGP
jgi:hypothetical protein